MSEVPGSLWFVLGALLLFSGFFSASETALFSLTRAQRAKANPTVRRLLSRPRVLLLSILICNLVVNVLFFAFSARLLPGDGGTGDALVGLGALVGVLVAGEILPKTLGLRARLGVARFAGGPLRVVVAALKPIARPVVAVLEATNRVVSTWFPEEKRVTAEVLARLMEHSAEEGHLLSSEADLLAEIVELEDIRVREIMTPRVDALFLDVMGGDREARVRDALDRRQGWLPVVEGSPDKVLGKVHVRDLLRRPDRPVRRLVMPVKFVPEVASAQDLLRGLRVDRTAEAIVVDEWGGTAGIVTAEDVFEEIVGDLREEGESRVPAVVPLGEGRFRVAGSLSIRDWNEHFGLAVVPTEFETVGGFVTALLGRIPRAGDETRAGSLVMLVNEVRGRRVLTVDIRVEESQPQEAAP